VLQAKVAKLTNGQRFVVRTPDAEVEVRGTVFRVEIVEPDATCANGARTRVSVSEGLVEVRGAGASTYIHPGESWPVGCARAASATVDTASSVAALLPPASPKPSGRTAGAVSQRDATEASARTVKEASSISLQNRLFGEANAARQQGDNARAVGLFEQLIARYPASPLAEGAAVQRMLVLKNIDPAAGRSAARQYLSRYPQGYAKKDAEKLAQP
jgi:hypothetical protein